MNLAVRLMGLLAFSLAGLFVTLDYLARGPAEAIVHTNPMLIAIATAFIAGGSAMSVHPRTQDWFESRPILSTLALTPLLVYIVVGVFGAPFVAEKSRTPAWLTGFFVASLIHAGVLSILDVLVVRSLDDEKG